ncbi:MAG: hypothetical protein PVH29_01865 [Candidatus Zixiibacteriota bacterium]|jgi:hypothetical protein
MRDVVIGLLVVLASALAISCQKGEPNTETVFADVKESEVQPAAGALVRWHPGLSLLEPGKPWRPVVVLYNHGLLYDKPFTDDSGSEVRDLRVLEIETNKPGVTVVGRLEKPTEVEITAARSVYTLLVAADEDPIGPRWGYYTWLKVRAQGKEGWATLRGVQPDFVGPYGARTGSFPDVSMYPDFPPLALVSFEERFSPLREGPAASFPRVKDVCRAREYANAGEVDAVVARFGDWLSISHGWLRADTPGLAFYYMTYAWRPYRGEEEAYFYLPVEGDVDRVIYSFDLNSLYRESLLPQEDPVMTVSAGGREYDLAIDSLDVFNNPTFDQQYFEAVLPEAAKREEIEAVTFTVGTEPHRVKATFDPREAWAEYDEGR